VLKLLPSISIDLVRADDDIAVAAVVMLAESRTQRSELCPGFGVPYLNIGNGLMKSDLSWRCSRIVRRQHLSCSLVTGRLVRHCFWR